MANSIIRQAYYVNVFVWFSWYHSLLLSNGISFLGLCVDSVLCYHKMAGPTNLKPVTALAYQGSTECSNSCTMSFWLQLHSNQHVTQFWAHYICKRTQTKNKCLGINQLCAKHTTSWQKVAVGIPAVHLLLNFHSEVPDHHIVVHHKFIVLIATEGTPW